MVGLSFLPLLNTFIERLLDLHPRAFGNLTSTADWTWRLTASSILTTSPNLHVLVGLLFGVHETDP